ncbi:MAG: ABC transporter ATP-binding protein [Bacilli bacterium]|nr:ABC transporter ATP-binding protein [Bacilli bacterium]
MKILECKDLCKNFGSKKVLKNINLEIESGKIIGLLGPNGSGKTTFIKLVNDLLTPTSGSILIKGEKPGIETKKIVSYLPDKNYLDDSMNILELIAFFKDFYEDFNEEKAFKLMKDLHLNEKDKLKNMSKGTKEKVQLILVMSRKAELYVLDEPIGGVDPAARDYILNTILNNLSENSSLIISTHLIDDIEKILDEVIFIKDGKIVLDNSADEIRTKTSKSIDALFREEFKC